MTRHSRHLWTAELEARLNEAPRPAKPTEHYHKRTPAQLEHEIQAAFVDTCALLAELGKRPELATLYAIPNGGHRHPAVGGKLKREGVKAGMPDLHLPVPRGAWASLYLEVKVPGKDFEKHQRARADELRAWRNVVVLCHSVGELLAATEAYLDGKIHDDTGGLAPAG